MRTISKPTYSQRLGRVLEIDPIPLKSCNWNCVYCHLGCKKPLADIRRDMINPVVILRRTRQLFHTFEQEFDWIAISGSGEPTLNASLGWLILQVKELTGLPVAVITNGSLLYLPEVRQELAAADIVMPTISAGTAGRYQQIHRPHPWATFERHIEGLIAFKAEFTGKLCLEVMLIRGLNDSEQTLRDIAAIFDRIQPDEVHISFPLLSPAELCVQCPDKEGLMRVM